MLLALPGLHCKAAGFLCQPPSSFSLALFHCKQNINPAIKVFKKWIPVFILARQAEVRKVKEHTWRHDHHHHHFIFLSA
jgi:hypothetical protein